MWINLPFTWYRYFSLHWGSHQFRYLGISPGTFFSPFRQMTRVSSLNWDCLRCTRASLCVYFWPWERKWLPSAALNERVNDGGCYQRAAALLWSALSDGLSRRMEKENSRATGSSSQQVTSPRPAVQIIIIMVIEYIWCDGPVFTMSSRWGSWAFMTNQASCRFLL